MLYIRNLVGKQVKNCKKNICKGERERDAFAMKPVSCWKSRAGMWAGRLQTCPTWECSLRLFLHA